MTTETQYQMTGAAHHVLWSMAMFAVEQHQLPKIYAVKFAEMESELVSLAAMTETH